MPRSYWRRSAPHDPQSRPRDTVPFRSAPTRYVPTRAHVRLLSPPRGARPAGRRAKRPGGAKRSTHCRRRRRIRSFRRRSTRSWRRSRFSGRGTARLARADTLRRDSVKTPRPAGAFLDDPITGKNTDSLATTCATSWSTSITRATSPTRTANLKADYMRIDMDSKMVYAYGKPDTLDGKELSPNPIHRCRHLPDGHDHLQPRLEEGEDQGVATQQATAAGGRSVKKMPDNTINIEHGKYTTCDHTTTPSFYLAMTKARSYPQEGDHAPGLPGDGGRADLLPRHPRGFFPINMGPKSGLLMPTYGEEYSKGFFLRDLGYYFTWANTPTWRCAAHLNTLDRGGFGRVALHQALQVQRQFQHAVFECKTAQRARTTTSSRATSASSGPLADPKANPVRPSRPRELRHERLQPLFGHEPQRHPLDADQLDGLLLEELAERPSRCRRTWPSRRTRRTRPLHHAPTMVFNVSRFYPSHARRSRARTAVREDLDAVHGKMTNSVTTTNRRSSPRRRSKT